jgi:hypothetical protein
VTKSIHFIAATALALAGLANAQIYKSVDTNGVVTFSETPPRGPQDRVEKLQTPAQVNNMQSILIAPTDTQEVDNIKDLAERSIAIVSPTDNATIPMGAGIFDVVVEAAPDLSDGEVVELYLDDEKVGDAQTTLKWTLTYVIRGAHKLQAKWIAEDGSILATSEPITVFVLRPSIL